MKRTNLTKFKTLFGYGIGDFGLNIYWKTISIYLIYWYTTIAGLDPRIAGLLFFIAMCWDAISDPVMATLSERVNTRYGTYRPFLLFGSIFLALSFILLFWVPPFQGITLVITLIVISIIFRTCYTIVAIPYSALTTRITYNSTERVDLSGARVFCAFCGLLAVSYFLPPLVELFTQKTGSEQLAFQLAAMIGGIIATLALILCFLMTQEKQLPTKTNQSERIITGIIQNLTTNRALQVLITIIALNAAATTCLETTLIFFIDANQNNLASKEVILTVFALSTLCFIPLWTYIIHYIGRKNVWLLVTALYVITALHMATFSTITLADIPIHIIIFGICIGAYAVLIWAFVPDCVEFGQIDGGYRSEASVLGTILIIQKLSSGLMGLAVGFAISSFNAIHEKQSILDINNTQINLFIAICPAVLIALSVIPIKLLPLGRIEHAKIMKRLNEGGKPHG